MALNVSVRLELRDHFTPAARRASSFYDVLRAAVESREPDVCGHCGAPAAAWGCACRYCGTVRHAPLAVLALAAKIPTAAGCPPWYADLARSYGPPVELAPGMPVFG